MINPRYYNDIKTFHQQFLAGTKIASNIKIDGKFDSAILCGMGGSAYYVDLINNLLQSNNENTKLDVSRGYNIPSYATKNTLIIIASYSGNTEETLSAFKQALEQNFKIVVFTSGGKLLELAKSNNLEYFQIPTKVQPRLSSGYFISGVIQVLHKAGLIKNYTNLMDQISQSQQQFKSEEKAKDLAQRLENKVPIIYTSEETSSIATISKIKFNENSKIQAFANVFPELNHNEMVGYTKLVMNPYFIIFTSKFTNKRNIKRMEIFKKVITQMHTEIEVDIIDMQGSTILEEIIWAYHFIDYVTYYLAEKYEIDPEPVPMVEKFKQLLDQTNEN